MLIDEHSTAHAGKLFQLLMNLTVTKLARKKSLSMWLINLVTVPSCDGRLILKKISDINIEILMS